MASPLIDLRSDTVTRPTPAMREAMLRADVGDDVFGEDPTVNALEVLHGRPVRQGGRAVLPQRHHDQPDVAVHVHTRPGDEVICDEGAHIYRYEGGASWPRAVPPSSSWKATGGSSLQTRCRAAIDDRQAARGWHGPAW
ncbi:MAG: beta-eliminating lyase-related protein [Flavobacteriales bacterium]